MELDSQSTIKIDMAIRNIQATTNGKVEKNSENPFHGSTYASLEVLLDLCLPLFLENDICMTHSFTVIDGYNCMVTKFSHESGEWKKSVLRIPTIDDKPQTFCASVTYLRRTVIKSFIGLAEVDDDGNQASGIKPKSNSLSFHKPPTVSAGTCQSCSKKLTNPKFPKCWDCNQKEKSVA